MRLWRIVLACFLILYGLLLGFSAIAAAILLLFDK